MGCRAGLGRRQIERAGLGRRQRHRRRGCREDYIEREAGSATPFSDEAIRDGTILVKKLASSVPG